jgi:hypothetical protein
VITFIRPSLSFSVDCSHAQPANLAKIHRDSESAPSTFHLYMIALLLYYYKFHYEGSPPNFWERAMRIDQIDHGTIVQFQQLTVDLS